MKILKRQDYLREYILACLRDSVLSPADLTSTTIFDKLLKVLSRDMREVLTGLGKEGGKRLLLGIAAKLMDV